VTSGPNLVEAPIAPPVTEADSDLLRAAYDALYLAAIHACEDGPCWCLHVRVDADGVREHYRTCLSVRQVYAALDARLHPTRA
jgi:hypothetical protein